MSTIKVITGTEMWTVTTTLKQCWCNQEIDTLLVCDEINDMPRNILAGWRDQFLSL